MCTGGAGETNLLDTDSIGERAAGLRLELGGRALATIEDLRGELLVLLTLTSCMCNDIPNKRRCPSSYSPRSGRGKL